MRNFERYIIARWAYSLGRDIMSDEEYDLLERTLKAENIPQLQEYFNRSWSTDPCPTQLLREHGFNDLVIDVVFSGEKSESMPSIIEEHQARGYFNQFIGIYHVSFKEDGWNVQIHYLNGRRVKSNTRGRTRDELSVENLKINIPDIIKTDRRYIRVYGEATLSDVAFARLQELLAERDLKSQRASVRSALAEFPNLITYKAFDLNEPYLTPEEKFLRLREWGFRTPDYVIAEDPLEGVYQLSERKKNYGYKADGAVVKLNSLNSEYVTRAVRIYNFSRKLYKAKIIGFEQEHALHFLSLKLLIEPTVTEDGGTQRRIDIDNPRRLKALGLAVGKYVVFTKVSDATEKIDELATLRLNGGEDIGI